MIWQATNSGKFWGYDSTNRTGNIGSLSSSDFALLRPQQHHEPAWAKALRGKMLDAARNAKSGAKWKCLNIMSCFYNSSLVCTWSRTSWPMQNWTISKASGWPSASFLSEAGTKQSVSKQTARDLVKLCKTQVQILSTAQNLRGYPLGLRAAERPQ
jgi:hypothetical protein